MRFSAEQPNQRWQADITHWSLDRGTDVGILNMLDDHSRLCLDSHALRVFKGPRRRPGGFRAAAGQIWESGELADRQRRGVHGRSRGRGQVALEVTLHLRGISPRHSRPYHPRGHRRRHLRPRRRRVARPGADVARTDGSLDC